MGGHFNFPTAWSRASVPKVSVAKAPTIFTGRGICTVRVPSPRMDAISV